jgi:hypothetical protein
MATGSAPGMRELLVDPERHALGSGMGIFFLSRSRERRRYYILVAVTFVVGENLGVVVVYLGR